jgi:hypothetical protein
MLRKALVTTLILSQSLTAMADPRRGSPAEYDPGPSPRSRWPSLFAETPNYRALGLAVLGDAGEREKFRWTFGPMYYRGRLAPSSVKVFIIGQEGAQDESLSNRSFTGGTGAKIQNFLNHIGVTQSYLFMNTFVYTINGQYTDQATGRTPEPLFWLAQNPESPVVQHRHEMFNYMLDSNRDTLRLVIAVGTAARDTLQAWVESHGGQCRNINSDCDSSVLGEQVKVLHVPHPGAASPRNGGSAAAARLVRAFTDAANKVAQWQAESGEEWLEADEGSNRRLVGEGEEARFSPSFRYTNAPVPYRDFAFGTSWRLGRGGTSSNRKDSQRSIQLFSENGCYNAVCGGSAEDERDTAGGTPVLLSYRAPEDAYTGIPGLPEGDIEWEAPRAEPTAFDPGPGPRFAALLMGEEEGFPMPDWTRLGVTQDPSFGHGALYRGRLDQAQVLVLADQESNDDLFTGRAMTGFGGQYFQTFLNAMGATESYAILRTIPVDTSDLSEEQIQRISQNDRLAAIRAEAVSRVLAKGNTQLILTVGQFAADAMTHIDTGDIPVVNLAHPASEGVFLAWQRSLREVAQLKLKFDARAERALEDVLTPIPRYDLPIQTKWWVGTSGTRSARPFNRETRALDGNYYKFYMPNWVFRMEARELSRGERAAVRVFESR